MTDDFDAFLRDRLGAEADRWGPVRPVENTRAELPCRIRRRRRAHAVIVTAVVAIVAVAIALVHLDPTAAGRQLDANPSIPEAPGSSHHSPRVPTQSPRPPATHPADRSRPVGAARSRPAAGGGTRNARGVRPNPPPVASPPATPTGTVAGLAPPTRSSVPTVVPPVSGPTSTGAPATQPQPTVTTTLPATSSVPPTPTTVPTQYVFTNSDAGMTASVPAGATIELELSGCPGTVWGPVVTSNPGVVAPQSSAPDPLVGSARIYLTAIGPGRAVLRMVAVTTSACPTLATAFRLTVDVVGNAAAT